MIGRSLANGLQEKSQSKLPQNWSVYEAVHRFQTQEQVHVGDGVRNYDRTALDVSEMSPHVRWWSEVDLSNFSEFDAKFLGEILEF